jgi:hypothetical protein
MIYTGAHYYGGEIESEIVRTGKRLEMNTFYS